MPLSSIIKKECPTCGKVAVESSRLELGTSKLITLQCGHVTSEDVIAGADYSALKSSDGRQLMPFQVAGVEFIEKCNARCLIADEQGLGKTVQALAALKLHIDELFPAIGVTKATLKVQWMWEFIRWTGSKKVQVLQTSKDRPIPGFDFYIITYDILKVDGMFDDIDIKTVIIDECQAVKNHLSGRAKAVQKITRNVPHIIALSGTPIKNNAGEYFTILNILQPSRFPEYQRYLNTYCDSYEQGFYGTKVGGLKDVEYFRSVTSDFIIRRTQEEVLPDLFALKQPRKFQHVELDKKLHKAYGNAMKELEEIMYAEDSDNSTAATIAVMTKLRQITGISKAIEAVDYVTEHILSTGRKIVIFAHHHAAVDLLEANLNSWLRDGGYNPCVMYRAGDNREKVIASFSQVNSPVLIASMLASGEGLDGLQHLCSDMILLERQWNPANEEQVEGRLARIGQTKPVNFIYMIASETIDEYFTELVEQKRAIVGSTLDGKQIEWNEQGLMKELAMVLVSKGAKKWRL